jgi:hypothetical protein
MSLYILVLPIRRMETFIFDAKEKKCGKLVNFTEVREKSGKKKNVF